MGIDFGGLIYNLKGITLVQINKFYGTYRFFCLYIRSNNRRS